jgi:hypothetical protein
VIKKLILVLLGMMCFPLAIIFSQRVKPEQILPDRVAHFFPDTLAGIDYDWDSIRSVIGDNKGLPPGYEHAALLAYSAYPQLKDVSINMVLTKSGAPMESNFELWTLLKNRSKRVYEIRLNDATGTPYDEILMRALPFDAQVGILAHELGHVVYYHNLSTLQLMNWGIRYLISKKFRAAHEKTTDLMPIYYGLGSQIYQYAWFVRYDATTRALYEKYGDFIDNYYLTDEELLKEIQKLR